MIAKMISVERQAMIEALQKIIAIVGSRKKLAELLGVHISSVNDWVQGRFRIAPRHVKRLARLSKFKVKEKDLRPDIF